MSTPDETAAHDRKVRELIDRDEIWQVLVRYSRGQDRTDRNILRSCYFEDAIDDHLGLFFGGVEDFIEWSVQAQSMFVSYQHRLTNHTCELAGDEAHTETYFQFVGQHSGDGPHVLSIGRYIDHFQRRSGEWRIATRVCVSDGRFTLNDLGAAFATQQPQIAHTVSRDRNDVSYERPVRARQVTPQA